MPKWNPLDGDSPELVVDLHGDSSERISIVIIGNERPEYLNLCLQSITIASLNNNYEIIVVDNGSKDLKMQTFLDEIEKDGIKVVRNEMNLYWTKAINQGFLAADPHSRYLVFMHHDITVTDPAWLDLMCATMDAGKDGLVNGLIGTELNTYGLSNGQRINYISDSCFMVTRECFKQAGPLPEELPQIGSMFIFNMSCNGKFGVQCIQNNLVKHWKVMAIDVSELEVLIDQAQAKLPALLQKVRDSISL